MRARETQVTHVKGQGDLKCPHLLPLQVSEAYLKDPGAPAPKTHRGPGHPEWYVPRRSHGLCLLWAHGLGRGSWWITSLTLQ